MNKTLTELRWILTQMRNKNHSGIFSSFAESESELKTKNRTGCGIEQVCGIEKQNVKWFTHSKSEWKTWTE